MASIRHGAPVLGFVFGFSLLCLWIHFDYFKSKHILSMLEIYNVYSGLFHKLRKGPFLDILEK